MRVTSACGQMIYALSKCHSGLTPFMLGEKYYVDIQDAVGEIHFSLPAVAENDLRKYGKVA